MDKLVINDKETLTPYWAYTHDKNGELVHDFGYFHSFEFALANVIRAMQVFDRVYFRKFTTRIVKNGETIWAAGPIKVRMLEGELVQTI